MATLSNSEEAVAEFVSKSEHKEMGEANDAASDVCR